MAQVKKSDWYFVHKIIEGALALDRARVVSYVEHFAARLEAEGPAVEATRLRASIARTTEATLSLAKLPVDAESRNSVADEERPKRPIHIYLDADAHRRVDAFIKHFRASADFVAHGISTSPTMLIHGPPGTGKTQLARHIAAELDMPLIVGRSDGLISSYLGSTAKNVRALFDHAAARPCVLFLDEFDAIAKKRDDERELGELKRVVISLLQNMDALDGDHIVIAATNHPHLLDEAVWRRFAYKIELAVPDAEGRRKLLSEFLRSYSTPVLVETGAALASGLSGAQIREIAEHCVRAAIVDNRTQVEPIELVEATLLATHSQSYVTMSLQDRLKLLHGLDRKAFNQSRLATLFGISQPHVSRLLKQESR